MIDRTTKFTCDDCGHKELFDTIDKAREARWAIARDGKTCYCPTCAPRRRHVGRAPRASGNQIAGQTSVFDGLKKTVN